MKRKQKQPELRPEGRDRWVVNLTERDLTPNQQEVLRMGLNFAPVPPSFPCRIPSPVLRRQPGDYRKMMLTTRVVVYVEY